MNEIIKLNKEEITKIQNLQIEYKSFQMQLGELEYQRVLVVNKLNEITAKTFESDKNLSEYVKVLQGKYGAGLLNLSTFQITREIVKKK